MRTTLTNDQFFEQLASFKRSAFRMELKPAYSVDGERDMYAKFLAGDPADTSGNRYYLDWLEDMARRAAAGITITRVRITDNPLTEYQRFLQWGDHLNRDAGEVIHYLDRAKAKAAGLPSEPDDRDWWLFDDVRVMAVTHDATGRRIHTELITDEDDVKQACLWRDLAITTARGETSDHFSPSRLGWWARSPRRQAPRAPSARRPIR